MTGDYKVKVLASGNVLRYRQTKRFKRGAIAAQFRNEPSEADMEEGKSFVESLVPHGATSADKLVFRGSQVIAEALSNNFLSRGGTTN